MRIGDRMSAGKNKIGILTFHCSNNYGAVLQAYALKSALQSLHPNHDVTIVDYRCKETISPVSFADIKRKRGIKGALLHYGQIQSVAKKFNHFRSKNLNLSVPYQDKTKLAEDIEQYDALVSGSDQVWNRVWSGGDDVYFQDFHCENQKKYSYAASFGFEKLKQEEIERYRNYLSDFHRISVREKSGVKIVRDQLALNAERHLDPTLLLEAEQWNKIAIDPKISGKYILVYMVPKQKNVTDFAQLLSKKTGYPIVMLSKNLKPYHVRHEGNSSPEEFIGWFKNAEYIVTNSFHGTAFSLIYHKKFCIDLHNVRGLNVRSKDLLDLCGLEYTLPKQNKMLVFDSTDWSKVDRKIQEERDLAYEYLATVAEQ